MWGEAIGSAATGAGTGFMFGGPPGAAIGAGTGLLLGLLGGAEKQRKTRAQNMFEAEKTRYSPWTKAGIGNLVHTDPQLNRAQLGLGTAASIYQNKLAAMRDEERLRRGLPSDRPYTTVIVPPQTMFAPVPPAPGRGLYSQGLMLQPNIDLVGGQNGIGY